MGDRKTLAVLEKHRDNLAATTTFEEYRDAHVKYVQMLIDSTKGDIARNEAKDKFAEPMWKFTTEVRIAADVKPADEPK